MAVDMSLAGTGPASDADDAAGPVSPWPVSGCCRCVAMGFEGVAADALAAEMPCWVPEADIGDAASSNLAEDVEMPLRVETKRRDRFCDSGLRVFGCFLASCLDE